MLTKLTDLIKSKLSGRSSEWRKVRDAHLKANPTCAVCEGTKKLNVHHIHPFHTHPELELDPANLITLCTTEKYGLNCHLLMGHLGNFKRVNPDSVTDAAIWNEKLRVKDGEVI